MSADSQLMTYLVRMVVPMRREFGVALDVHQFVHDRAYATEMINRARASVDPRLRDYAENIQKRLLLGPRAASAPGDPVARPTQPAPPTAPAPLAGAEVAAPAAPAAAAKAADSEAELRARMLKKYTTGLR
jgi:hypothetical protein